jgi:hypothetical protein
MQVASVSADGLTVTLTTPLRFNHFGGGVRSRACLCAGPARPLSADAAGLVRPPRSRRGTQLFAVRASPQPSKPARAPTTLARVLPCWRSCPHRSPAARPPATPALPSSPPPRRVPGRGGPADEAHPVHLGRHVNLHDAGPAHHDVHARRARVGRRLRALGRAEQAGCACARACGRCLRRSRGASATLGCPRTSRRRGSPAGAAVGGAGAGPPDKRARAARQTARTPVFTLTAPAPSPPNRNRPKASTRCITTSPARPPTPT